MEKMHPPIPTVSDHAWDVKTLFKPMDIIHSQHPDVHIGIVLMGPINIPYFEDGCASQLAYTPLDIENPEEWQMTFPAYIVYDLAEQKYAICPQQSLKKYARDMFDGYIPFDVGTARLRCVQGLIELAKKWYKTESSE